MSYSFHKDLFDMNVSITEMVYTHVRIWNNMYTLRLTTRMLQQIWIDNTQNMQK